jgi:hypothetical protein
MCSFDSHCIKPGSLAMPAAIRRASSLLSNFAAGVGI